MKETRNNTKKKIVLDIDLIKICSYQTDGKLKEIISFLRRSVNEEESGLPDGQQEMQAQKAEETPLE